MLKIFEVVFNDGRWHSGPLQRVMVVSDSKENAIEKGRKELRDTTSDVWATEFKVDGYIIEVYDEKTYSRNKNIEELVK